MRAKTIVNNCISDIINNNKFNNIFVYGSENLELEKLIYNLTSSPIIGGDVDFCNVLLGKYFSNNKDLDLNEEIYNNFKLGKNCTLSNVEKLALAIIYKSYRPKQTNEHNKRVFNNVVNNKDKLIREIKNQKTILKILSQIKLEDVKHALQCCHKIEANNKRDNTKKKTTSQQNIYYLNPDFTVHLIVENIMKTTLLK